MIFASTPLAGAFVIEPERKRDDRGFFARTFCRKEFENAGLNGEFVQCNVSHNERAGTLRGMHWQAPPHGEAKLIRCAAGSIWDVIIDLRPTSLTYTAHFGITLTARAANALYVPEGFAHGFVTLEAHSEVVYQMSNYYDAAAGRGIRWNDPAFGIDWPIASPFLHPRDAAYPDFVPDAMPLAV